MKNVFARLSRRSTIVALGIAAVVIAVAGIAYAAAPPSPINACVMKSTGGIRIITTGQCKSTETPLTWNVQGPPGTPGVPGLSGYTLVRPDVVTFAPGETKVVEAFCPVGSRVLGGGFLAGDPFLILDSFPREALPGPDGILGDADDLPESWVVQARSQASGLANLSVRATCAQVAT